MNIIKVKDIFIKELSIEYRQKFALGGIFLFAATVVFLIFKSFNNINPREWTILIWIIMLFAGLNAVVKSFLQEKKETYLYYYTLFDPIDMIVAKLAYNFIFLCSLFAIILIFMGLFSGFPVKDWTLFFSGSALGILGISIVFTFVSVISASENGNSTLMSILALPLVLPILLLLLKISAVSVRLLTDTAIMEDVWLLMGVDCILLGAMILLFPALWRL
ncbi:MAG: heme exporter protein CcmB [Saprospiraceae bacterium]|nr:heme exporter protein CcmB [Saprospiraceae bacterium]MBK8671154.1 heme exporter protein CcmB [Saprospiraceae bacterium]